MCSARARCQACQARFFRAAFGEPGVTTGAQRRALVGRQLREFLGKGQQTAEQQIGLGVFESAQHNQAAEIGQGVHPLALGFGVVGLRCAVRAVGDDPQWRG